MEKENIPNDLYFDILKFGRSKLNVSLISMNELFTFLNDKGYGQYQINNALGANLWSALVNEVFKRPVNSFKDEYILSSEAYFQLLEHERLEESRIDSKKALTRSTWAIVITAIFAVIQIIFQILEYCK